VVRNYTFILFALFLLQGCFFDKKINNNLDEPICIASQSACSVKTSTGEFFITFNQAAPKAESPFEIYVNYQGQYRVEKLSGFIEGVDMFMGKIPLFFKTSHHKQSYRHSKKLHERPHDYSFVTPAMFGSCSLDIMKWRVMLEAELALDGIKQTQPFFIELTSQR